MIFVTDLVKKIELKERYCPKLWYLNFDNDTCFRARCMDDSDCAGETKCCENSLCHFKTCAMPTNCKYIVSFQSKILNN